MREAGPAGGAGDYLDLEYVPRDDDVLGVYRVTPREDTALEDAAAALAAEASVGLWTELPAAPVAVAERLRARVFRLEGDLVHIAFPGELFEPGNLPGLLAVVAGNVFGFGSVPAVRLEDLRIPLGVVEGFPGPAQGISGVRALLRVHDRPLACATVKPNVGLSPREHAALVRETLLGGLDLVKDDESLTGQPFSPFEERAGRVLEAVAEAAAATGEAKAWCANITAGDAEEMVRRAEAVRRHGGTCVVVDFLSAGLAATATVRCHCARLGLALMGHRTLHAALDRWREHGVDSVVLARWARLTGLDLVLVGGRSGYEGRRAEVRARCRLLREASVPVGDGLFYPQDWGHLKPAMPVVSGGLVPRHVWDLHDAVGRDAAFLFAGGCHAHPGGSRAGAAAIRAAVEAAAAGVSPERAAARSAVLRQALEHWAGEP